MRLQTESYVHQSSIWPSQGRHILAQSDADWIVVYQAYRPAIGKFAAEHGYFGGEFSFNRMSWVKPNFLWMMYRSGWGTKADQEVTLAIWLKRGFFERALAQAVPSSFVELLYASHQDWKDAVGSSDVRLQWDPDHSPSGAPLERRAIQLGFRGEALREYGKEAILHIEDISDFVAEQRLHVVEGNLGRLVTPTERVFMPEAPECAQRLGIEGA